MLNRPQTPLDSAPLDGASVLTTRHFLIVKSLKVLPEVSNTSTNISSLKRWNLCKALPQQLWEQWCQDYLRQMQQFHRWKHPKRSVQVGDIVLLKDSELYTHSWPLARVIEVHAGTDGLVRVVTLRTEKGIYRRAVTRLVPLLLEEEPAVLPPEDVRV